MSVVVDVTIPPESFTLAHALAAASDVTVRAERMASHSTEQVLPFLWASGGDIGGFRAAMADDPAVVDVSTIESTDGHVLLLVAWHDAFINLIDEMIDQHANILVATAIDERWHLKLRFAEDDQVSAFRDYFDEHGRTFEVQRLYHPTVSHKREFGLTAEQHEVLTAALREGYFTVPRSVSIEELASSLGISSNATSERLRRATENLVRHALMIDADGTVGET